MPNRIEPTTVANAAEDSRLAQVPTKALNPSALFPILGAALSGALTFVGAVVSSGAVLSVTMIAGAAITGLGVGIAGYFGIKSSGTLAK